MKIRNLDINKKVMIIAEIGNNHEGNYSTAVQMIHQAAKSGVDAVKFQTFATEHYVSQHDQKRFAMLKKFELSQKEFIGLKEEADKAGVIFLSTPFDIDSAKFLNPLVPAFKISSGDNNFYPLLQTVARFGKPILLSTGLSDMSDINQTKLFIETIWAKHGFSKPLALLHCVSSYPVAPDEANLAAIPAMKQTTGCPIGYSDHTLGIEAAVASIALGARIVEKHFTLDKHFSSFRDHALSADPQDMLAMVQQIRLVEKMLGTGKKNLQEGEKETLLLVRRSIIATKNLSTGTCVQKQDISWVRPAGGLPPGKEDLILGKTLAQRVAKDEQFTPEMFSHPVD